MRCNGEAERGGDGLLHRHTGFNSAAPHAELARLFDAVHQLRTDHALRNTVELGGQHDAICRSTQVFTLGRVGNRAFLGQQEARAHGDARRAIGHGALGHHIVHPQVE